MTTYIHTVTILTLILIVFAAAPVFAQEEVASNIQKTTVLDPIWFEIEQLEPLAVGDFVVGPGRSEIQLEPGQSYVQNITVTNRISDNREFRLEIEDIVGTDDASEAVSLLGNVIGPYSIRNVISFPEDSFELDLGMRATIPVTIKVPADAAPGGYYGSVLVSTVQINDDVRSQVPRSPIIARVGTLFFVTVSGDVEQAGETRSVDALGESNFFQTGPIDLAVLYENTGSVHTNPYGEISITNIFGEEVGFIELEPWFVLPDSLRSREVSWDREFLIGPYTVTARVNRGYNDIVDEVQTSFWVLPWKIVTVAFVVLFVIIFLIRFIVKNFEFKRKPN